MGRSIEGAAVAEAAADSSSRASGVGVAFTGGFGALSTRERVAAAVQRHRVVFAERANLRDFFFFHEVSMSIELVQCIGNTCKGQAYKKT